MQNPGYRTKNENHVTYSIETKWQVPGVQTHQNYQYLQIYQPIQDNILHLLANYRKNKLNSKYCLAEKRNVI